MFRTYIPVTQQDNTCRIQAQADKIATKKKYANVTESIAFKGIIFLSIGFQQIRTNILTAVNIQVPGIIRTLRLLDGAFFIIAKTNVNTITRITETITKLANKIFV